MLTSDFLRLEESHSPIITPETTTMLADGRRRMWSSPFFSKIVIVVLQPHREQTCLLPRPLRLCCHLHFGLHLAVAVLLRIRSVVGAEAQGVASSNVPPENARVVCLRSLTTYAGVEVAVFQAGVAVWPCRVKWTARTVFAEIGAVLLDSLDLRLLGRWSGRAT
jgi:hypothetical protein